MGLLSFSAAPVEPKQPAKRKQQQPAVNRKGDLTRRRVDPSAQIYGESLFKSARSPEKEIVICFNKFTTNFIRVSKCGRFAIHYTFIPPNLEEYKDVDESIYLHGQNQFVLYHFIEPIEYEYVEEVEYKIEVTDELEVFGPFETVLEMRDIVCKVLKEEYLQNRANKLALIRAQEINEKLAKEASENEEIRIETELAKAGMGGNFSTSKSSTEKPREEGREEKEIYVEKIEETSREDISTTEIRTPTAGFLVENERVKPLIDLEEELKSTEEHIIEEAKPKTEAEIWMEQFMKGK